MKKEYRKAEAFRVGFNANEQVAAACAYTAADYETKYPVDTDSGSYSYCEDYGLYSDADVAFCVIYEDGSTYMGTNYNDYLQYED